MKENKDIEYMLIRTKTDRIFFELRIPRLSVWKRSIARIRFHKDNYRMWETNDAFNRFIHSDQYKPIMALIDACTMENDDIGWKKSYFGDKERISFIHELDKEKISF